MEEHKSQLIASNTEMERAIRQQEAELQERIQLFEQVLQSGAVLSEEDEKTYKNLKNLLP